MRAQSRSLPPARPPIGLGAHALATLEYIRGSIESASSFAVPGMAGIAMGTIGVAACLLAALSGGWALETVWLAAAVPALLSGAVLMVQRARRSGTTLYRGAAGKFWLCLAPTLVAGALLTAALWRFGAEELLPGVWLSLYGAGVMAASTTTRRCVTVMGLGFVMLGVLALILPPEWHNALLGAGFGGLHLAFGIYLRSTESRGNP